MCYYYYETVRLTSFSIFLFKVAPFIYLSMCSGDRTPKQKVKLKVTEEKLLNLMLKYNGGRPRAEVIYILLSSIFPCSFSLLGVCEE